jgi:hypothetical protein
MGILIIHNVDNGSGLVNTKESKTSPATVHELERSVQRKMPRPGIK